MKLKRVTSIVTGSFMAITVSGALFYSNNVPETNVKKTSFIDVKWKLKKIYEKSSLKKTFYCNCRYSNYKNIDRGSCGYKPRRENRRSKQVEWEHIYPISRFGKTRPCWWKAKTLKKNPREYCAKNDNIYRRAENDAINLVPSVGELNLVRSNHSFGHVIGEERRFGSCDFEDRNKITEPKENIRGDIARIWFYMESVHKVPITRKDKLILLKWKKDDPLTNEERYLWNKKIRMMKNETN